MWNYSSEFAKVLKVVQITLFFAALQLSGMTAVCPRGTCEFATKAEVAQSAGAAVLLLINDDKGCKFGVLIVV